MVQFKKLLWLLRKHMVKISHSIQTCLSSFLKVTSALEEATRYLLYQDESIMVQIKVRVEPINTEQPLWFHCPCFRHIE